MANEELIELLKRGPGPWNRWRDEEPDKKIDLSRANLVGLRLMEYNFQGVLLREANLQRAHLREANLHHAILLEADLEGADLFRADLSKAILIGAALKTADLTEADLTEADLTRSFLLGANLTKTNLTKAQLTEAYMYSTNLSGANLEGADLRGANLYGANLSGANLSGTDLSRSSLVGVKINGAKISKSNIYGVNVWDLEGEFEEQKDLLIGPYNASPITVDNIKVAQFIYLILNNKEIRDVINTLTSKTVLILGRFALPERKQILDALRDKLREYDLLPIVFDFDRPTDKDFTETIKTLAGMCYFVIADVTNPKSSPLELQATVPDYQIPFVPIIQEGEKPFAMMVDLQKKYNWVLDTVSYDSLETLIDALKPAIIDRAIQKHNELRLIKAQQPKILSASDFIDDKGLDS